MLPRRSRDEEFSDYPCNLPFVDGSYPPLLCPILEIFSRPRWFKEELIFHQTFFKPERRISWALY